MFGSVAYELNWLERCAAEVIKIGPIPKHIAVILDGNRRFAKKNQLQHVSEGHKAGREKLYQLIDMSLAIGIKEITAYVFSKENFKRPKDEVDAIMEILADELQISDEKLAKLKTKGVCIEIIGDLREVPSEKLRVALEESMLKSKDHANLKVNLAFIYTGRNEIASGVNHLVSGLMKGEIGEKEVAQEILHDTFTLHPSNPVDILVRTSGECRLSDFVMWGCSEAYLEFVGVTWPEFSFWGLTAIIFRYQNQVLQKGLKQKSCNAGGEEVVGGPSKFVDEIRKQSWNQMAMRAQS